MITVAELKELLEDFDDDLLVVAGDVRAEIYKPLNGDWTSAPCLVQQQEFSIDLENVNRKPNMLILYQGLWRDIKN